MREILFKLFWIVSIVGGAGCLVGANSYQTDSSLHAPEIVRFFSPTIRNLETELRATQAEKATLPEPPLGPKGGSFGYHSYHSNTPFSSTTLTIDLEASYSVDSIVLIAANVVYGIGPGYGYGFPLRFRIELSESRDFTESYVLVDHSEEAVPNPGAKPLIYEANARRGRYVRFTALELWRWKGNDLCHLALGEILVFSGGRNVALRKPVAARNSLEGKPFWAAENLVDGQSSLGHPIARGRSVTNGYHGEIEDSPDIVTWVQVDLGVETDIDEVKLVPARPVDYAEIHGFGFPPKFRVEAANDPDFLNPITLFEREEAFPNPGDNALGIPTRNLRARWIRVTATELWQRDDNYVFALSELEVFSKQRNVALAAKVTASRSYELGHWSTLHLVDGHDSQDRLETDELGWLRGVARHQELLEEETLLMNRLARRIHETSALLTRALIAMGGGFLVFTGFLIFRNQMGRKRDLASLRKRIASDLHDEIGSNLGTILLLSELHQGEEKEELDEINRIARETGQSMRDIVWVIEGGHDTLADLVHRMREVVAIMLKHHDYDFEADLGDRGTTRLSMESKRNALLFVKEAVYNIVRHSGAGKVKIQLGPLGNQLRLCIQDDGCGFDFESAWATSGAGLKNLKGRAEELGGSMEVRTAPGEGTCVTLTAPFL